MDKFLFETQRLKLSTWKKEDLELASSLWGNKEVMKLLSSKGYYTNAEILERLKREMDNLENFGVQYWKLHNAETLKFIGCCGFKPCEVEGNTIEFGFQLLPEFWGLGYAMEASLFCISYSLNILKNDQIYSGHHPQNKKSAKLLQKLGFKQIDYVYYEPTGLMHPFYKYTNNSSI